ncbi:tetratricopeptide repeat protein [Amaricoccus solimangrovi]|uniref:tetratricopeptide repeat protein n=1 Tax=Amaricoccus solimangrovi TaxID=2589815 RepID=UPI0015E4558E|nr:tetratricopeptide repeat protein [Amaricoccus solimangrovi]
MSQSDSFFNEVDEEVRRDRLRRGLGRYGWLIGLVILGLVGGAAFVEWRKHAEQVAAEKAGDALRAASLESDPAKRAEALATVAGDEPRAAAVARLAEAGSQMEAGDTGAAAATLASLAEQGDTPELYRSLAALLRVMLLGDAMDPAERNATLETLSDGESPFQALALEQRALGRLAAGDREGAFADLGTILKLPQAPEQVSTRARQLLQAAGGEAPAVPALPATPSEG